ncbi:MAG: hypothetical protein ACI4B8_01085 [Candidatus Gastranaerophilaceae bacterium]
MLKKILTNALLLTILLVIVEVTAFCIASSNKDNWVNKQTFSQKVAENFKEYFKTPDTFEQEVEVLEHLMRKPQGENFSKRPIVITGCSIAHGVQLKDDETFGHILSAQTQRPVYNNAFWGWGLQQTLRMMQNGKFYERINGNPEYLFYVCIYNHRLRQYFYQDFFYNSRMYVRYKLDKNGDLVYVTPKNFPFVYRFYTIKLLQKFIQDKKMANKSATSRLFLKTIEAVNSDMKKHFPDCKMVVLLYSDEQNDEDNTVSPTENFFSPAEQKELSKNDILIINMEQICGKSFKSHENHMDRYHPNAKFWGEVVPELKKQLNL